MRRELSRQARNNATERAYHRPVQQHARNGEEQLYGGYDPELVPAFPVDMGGKIDQTALSRIRAMETSVPIMTYSKGLPHSAKSGVANFGETVLLRAAINGGVVRGFDEISIGRGAGNSASTFPTIFYGKPGAPKLPNASRKHRRWEAPTAGFVFDLEGPDAQAVTMPPAPTLDDNGQPDPELVAEMAEVYWLSLLRDEPFSNFEKGARAGPVLKNAVTHLSSLEFYKSTSGVNENLPGEDFKVARVRPTASDLSIGNVFRGQTHGDLKGPYISQFLLIGNEGIGGAPDGKSVHAAKDGFIQYGSILVDQRVRIATPELDYMTHWNEWLDVQNGANVRDTQQYEGKGASAYRFIATPRDLATYVHFDALYEAYLNACLWLLAVRAPFDPKFEFLSNSESTEGFAQFGGPHILSLVTEVATRALKAVRFQKFNNHLRLRPEALAGLVSARNNLHASLQPPVSRFEKALSGSFTDESGKKTNLLKEIGNYNKDQNKRHASYLSQQSGIAGEKKLPLLPMAFPEGSPMHPAYGAGHATVAGACVTVLKAFFDETALLVVENNGKFKRHTAKREADLTSSDTPFGYHAASKGTSLKSVRKAIIGDGLTVGDELNKLAANISIGRNMAGVHYYTDYIESLVLGEEIAAGILSEQALTYSATDKFTMSFNTFGGKMCVIGKDGHCAVI